MSVTNTSQDAPSSRADDTPVSDTVEAVAESAAQSQEAVENTVASWSDQLAQTVRTRPYASLAVAAGVGYVAAAGVPNFVLKAVAGQGMKLATGALVGALVADEAG